jgi:hypothetical protein
LAERTRAHNLTLVAYAPCPGLHCPSEKCPSSYEPVCATNGWRGEGNGTLGLALPGRSYANLCELDKSICVLRSGRGRGTGARLALDYIGKFAWKGEWTAFYRGVLRAAGGNGTGVRRGTGDGPGL